MSMDKEIAIIMGIVLIALGLAVIASLPTYIDQTVKNMLGFVIFLIAGISLLIGIRS